MVWDSIETESPELRLLTCWMGSGLETAVKTGGVLTFAAKAPNP
jgi:hypothetical protein